MILVDSFIEWRVLEVDVSSHTHLGGVNGAGKTTLLKLCPIFYGEKPSILVKRDESGKKSFTDYYLPRSGSCLVYEYLVDGSPRMAVFRALAEDGRFAMVFVDSPYRRDLFVDAERQTIYPSNTLIDRLRQHAIHYYQPQSLREYQQTLLERNTSQGRRYGIGRNLRRLPRLITEMFRRSADLTDLARVVQDYVLEGLSEKDKSILKDFSTDRGVLQTSLDDLKIYLALDGMKDKVAGLGDLRATLDLQNRHILAAATAARSTVSALEDEKAEKNRSVEVIESELTLVEATHKDNLKAIDSSIKSKQVELDSHASAVDAINCRESRFADLNLEHWRLQLEQKPQISSRLLGLQNQHRKMLEKSQSVEQDYNLRKLEIVNIHSDSIAAINKQSAEATEKLEQQKEALLGKQRQEVKSQQLKHRACGESISNRIKQLEVKQAERGAQMKSPEASPEVLRRKEVSSQNLAVEQDLYESAIASENERSEAWNQTVARKSAADRNYDQAKRNFDRAEEEHDKIYGLLYSRKDSLYGFLNENRPGWEETLGRVLRMDILERTDLSPALAGDGESESLCGVLLDFAGLPSPEADLGALEAQVEQLGIEKEKAESELNSAERELNSLSRAVGKERLAYEAAEGKTRSAKSRRNKALEEDESARMAVRESQQVALRKLKEAHREVGEALGCVEADRKKLVEIQATEDASLEAEHTSQREDLQQQQASNRQRFAKARATADAVRDDDLSGAETLYHSQLSEQGVSTADLKLLEANIEEVNQQLNKLGEMQGEIEQYDKFVKTDIPRRVELRQSIYQLDEEIAELKVNRESLVEDYRSRTALLQEIINSATVRIGVIEREQEQLRNGVILATEDLVLNLTPDDPALKLAMTKLPVQLYQDYQSLRKNKADTLGDLKATVRPFVKVFESMPSSASGDYFTVNFEAGDSPEENTLAEASCVLTYFLGEQNYHGHAKDRIRDGFLHLNKVANYVYAIKAFRRRVNAFSRDLASHVSRHLEYAAIQEIAPAIVFDLDRLDHWRDIESLADQISSWQPDDLPDQSLIDALNNYLDVFNAGRRHLAVDDLWRHIDIRVRVVENGNERMITTGTNFNDSSSNGLSYIILIHIFIGFIDCYRRGQDVRLTWALDELGSVDTINQRVMLKQLKSMNVNMVTACPELQAENMQMFDKAYEYKGSGSSLSLVDMQITPLPEIRNDDGSMPVEFNPFDMQGMQGSQA
jgi:hypothetical protein